MFSDKYLDQERNEKFREMIFEFLTTGEKIKIIPTEQDDADVWDYHVVPDTTELADKPKLCLTDAITQNFSLDYTKLFEHKMYSMNTNLGKYEHKIHNFSLF